MRNKSICIVSAMESPEELKVWLKSEVVLATILVSESAKYVKMLLNDAEDLNNGKWCCMLICLLSDVRPEVELRN